jgi:hypothetical protein
MNASTPPPREAPRARRKPPGERLDPLAKQLLVMGARRPTADEFAAVRALMRGRASAGQQRTAVSYLMAELCGVGEVPFTGESSHATAFRAGSLAVGIAMAAIADVVIMRFPDEIVEEASDAERTP